MNSMTAEAGGGETEGGPMWGRFFESIGGGDDGDSVLSGSHAHTDTHSRGGHHLNRSVSHFMQSPYPEVHPNDSASVVDEDHISALEGYGRGEGGPSIVGGISVVAPPPVDDGTYVFKFRTPSGRTHRFQSRHDDVEHLRDIIAGKLATDPFFTEYEVKDPSELPPDPIDFQLSYTDADGDIVLITSDTDVSDAVKIARAAKQDRVVLFIQGGKGWSSVEEKSKQQAAQQAAAAAEEIKEVERSEAASPEKTSFTPSPPAPVHVHEEEKVMGVPKDLLLPASIGALAAVILGVFTISRLTR